MSRRLSLLQWAPMALSFGVLALAIAQELSKPRAERVWNGRVLGFIPYDFRPPSLERIRASLWNPDDPHVLTRQVFGVGWSINLYAVTELLRRTGL
jgi:hypothetical protein